MIKRHADKRKKRASTTAYAAGENAHAVVIKANSTKKLYKNKKKKSGVTGRGRSNVKQSGGAPLGIKSNSARQGNRTLRYTRQDNPIATKKTTHMSMSVKCMVFCDGEVLLLQKKDREGLRPWEFPGGGLEFGEDLRAAAIREVREETGLSVQVLDVAGLWSFARTKTSFLTGVIFVAETTSKKVRLSHEHTDYAWVRPADFHRYHLQKSLRTALEAIRDTSPRGDELRHYFVETFR